MMIDLTRELYREMPTYPLHPKVDIKMYRAYEDVGFAYESISICGHSGTHVDAPVHFIPNRKTVDMINLEKLCGNAILLDFTYKKPKEPIRREDIKKYKIKPGEIVILRTGYEKYWGKKKYLEEHPALSKDGAELLVEMKINTVGIDTPSIDLPSSTSFPAHKTLLAKNIYIIENLCNLDKIPERFKFIGLPLKVKGATASPIRAVGIL